MEDNKFEITDVEKELISVAKVASAKISCEMREAIDIIDLQGQLDCEKAYWFCVLLLVSDLTSKAIARMDRSLWHPKLKELLNLMINNADRICRNNCDSGDSHDNSSPPADELIKP